MKTFLKNAFLALVLVTSLSFFNPTASAIDHDPADKGASAVDHDPADKPKINNNEVSIKLKNPLNMSNNGGIDNIPDLVKAIVKIALTIGIPLIVLAIIYSGYLFIAAQGSPDKLKVAKDTLLYVIVGAAILLGAYVIAEAVVGTINAIRG